MQNLRKKTLFVTPDYFPFPSGGTVVFNELTSNISSRNLYWYVCSKNSQATYLKNNFEKTFSTNFLVFDNKYINYLARNFKILGIVYFFLFYELASYISYLKLKSIIEKHQIEVVWIYLRNFSIPVTHHLLKSRNVKVHLSLQDDVTTHLSKFEYKYLNTKFEAILKIADSYDFISETMEKYYREKFQLNKPSLISMLGPKINVEYPKINDKITKIGFAGNIWEVNSFVNLMKALKKIRDENDISIKLFIFSNTYPNILSNEFEDLIEYKGFVEQAKLIIFLQECDLLYLPMTFDLKKSLTNVTSFPSKVITYLNTGIPVLNHSPSSSSSHEFIVKNEVGFSITSDVPDVIANSLRNEILLSRTVEREKMSFNSKNLLSNFDKDIVANKFVKLLNDLY